VAEKKPIIVIKKITVVAGGGHGGAWKVAFADFMTAMMAFFLVMWLITTASDEQKEAISDYFSSPSIIEYQFNNYGVELTLEKLFLDLVNEPLKVFKSFIDPIDRTPNIMAMGMKKVVMSYMADQLGSYASHVEVNADSVVFEIPDHHMFNRGTPNPNGRFVEIMERIKGVTAGLEDSQMNIVSVVYKQSVSDRDQRLAKKVADERLELIKAKVKNSLESDTVELYGQAYAGDQERRTSKPGETAPGGYVRIEINQKQILSDGKKPKPLADGVFEKAKDDKNVYDNFVNQLSKKKSRDSQSESSERRATGR
jgi:chemotaxis protein MotB